MFDLADLEPEKVRPLRRTDYERLVEMGAFADERVELLYGMVVSMTPIGPAHEEAVDRLTALLVGALGSRARVRVQNSLASPTSESIPQPDLAVVPPADYSRRRPDRALLVVEVAESSLRKDQRVKARLYAESGVPEYWIVNLADGRIEVHRDPADGAYRTRTEHGRGEAVTLLGFPDVYVRVDDVLP